MILPPIIDSMKVKNILIGLFVVLSCLYSCSAQKKLSKEYFSILEDVFKPRKIKISSTLLDKNAIETHSSHYSLLNYLSLDKMEELYNSEALAKIGFKNPPNSLSDILKKEDFSYMRKQYNKKQKIAIMKDATLADSIWLSPSKNFSRKVSVPLLSEDSKKCIFVVYNWFSRQTIPELYISRKYTNTDKWEIITVIPGGTYDTSPPFD